MEFKVHHITAKVHYLITKLEESQIKNEFLEDFIKKKDINVTDIEKLLNFLCKHIFIESFTLPIANAFEDFLLYIILTTLKKQDDELLLEKSLNTAYYGDYQLQCRALAKLMDFSPIIKKNVISYLQDKPIPFKEHLFYQENDSKESLDNLSILETCYHLLKAEPTIFRDLWDWSEFVEYCQKYIPIANRDKSCELLVSKSIEESSTSLKRSEKYQFNELDQLYVNNIMALLMNMNNIQLNELNNLTITDSRIYLQFEERVQQFSATDLQRYNKIYELKTAIENQYKLNVMNIDSTLKTIKTLTLYSTSLVLDYVTQIEGVFLPVFNKTNYSFYSKTDGYHDRIVRVKSTRKYLRSIAFGVTSGRAICLSGPVGCGKTTLIEYLARRTGRIPPKENECENCENNSNNNINSGNLQNKNNVNRRTGFYRIQLGDQTDSKMLLGQYNCTDVPGEFIWLPGILTQAVMNGDWLLLEDLDSATQDCYTILSNLLENNYLSVPGYRDYIRIAPSFQLFTTVRVNKNNNSQHGSNAGGALHCLLAKYLYTINILPLSRLELCEIVGTNYPKLATIANRMVDIFLTFSHGHYGHEEYTNLANYSYNQDEMDDSLKNVLENSQINDISLPHEKISVQDITKSRRLVSTRDLIKLCKRSHPTFEVTNIECAYFVFQNAIDIFCSYIPSSTGKTKLISSVGAKLGIIPSRCEYFANTYRPQIEIEEDQINIGRINFHLTTNDSLKSKSNCYTKGQMNGDNTAKEVSIEPEFKKIKLSSCEEYIEKIGGAQQYSASFKSQKFLFSFTRVASCLLERVAVCVRQKEPLLLVGETGVGKTSSVQYLAECTGHKLIVINMNNQSDVTDLLGGFKPVDLAYTLSPLNDEFETLFCHTFNRTKNETFLHKYQLCYGQGNYMLVIQLMMTITKRVKERIDRNENINNKFEKLIPRWSLLQLKVERLYKQLRKSINISFAFIPGSLVKCIENGDWLLLDEINLASAETLECLSLILEPEGSIVLLERGDTKPIRRHPDFRVFSCMNPNTDIGKKDLPVDIRNRFTEIYVDELTTDNDLSLLIWDYLNKIGIQKPIVMNIVRLYKKLKELTNVELSDGLGNRPVYSLRNLCRALQITSRNLCGSFERNLYEAFCLSFLTQLDTKSHKIVEQLIKEYLLTNVKAALKHKIPRPITKNSNKTNKEGGGNDDNDDDDDEYVNIEGYWIQRGDIGRQNDVNKSNYILTEMVKENLKNLVRIISIGRLPILLQGPTSAGKTSLIEYVAQRSGNICFRINNHEHTDLQEYIGTYVTDINGKLVFREGVLVEAMRHGYWIILDELNLASTEILEALNRVLDDNRELYIAETQQTIQAHPKFMCFATQNPPGLYGGRKTLSRAFKNRFIELHFAEIPHKELEIILEKRCKIPTSYARKMVSCMMDLQKNCKTVTKNVFTLRDLFRWGNRYTMADPSLLEDIKYDWNQHLIEEGYLILSAKVRTAQENEIIEKSLYKYFKKCVDLQQLFNIDNKKSSMVTQKILKSIQDYHIAYQEICWTPNIVRMAVLTAKALEFNEPVLLVGPTGCGKTTVCQILAIIKKVSLCILNCHMHTEGADFLGGLRPTRHHENLNDLNEDENSNKLFEWSDGPLIQAMQNGSYFMADEISLAEDSVLERLNSVLEPERKVLLAEKGGGNRINNIENGDKSQEFVVVAKEGFQFLATMNPGGDFGKKELSPALRNRFTEIWCQTSLLKEDLIQIIINSMKPQNYIEKGNVNYVERSNVNKIAQFIVEITLFIDKEIEKFNFSIRDILSWSKYIQNNDNLDITLMDKLIFGLETVYLDALEMIPQTTFISVESQKEIIMDYVASKTKEIFQEEFSYKDFQSRRHQAIIEKNDNNFGIKPFYLNINNNNCNLVKNGREVQEKFMFDAPTTKENLFRILSALTLNKPILLEGPPGVGKTSIIENLAKFIGYDIVRINLCEHTDLSDLFGTDLPVENESNLNGEHQAQKIVGLFQWHDGPLLAALKSQQPTWILLDELNLAPQSVLEGLNAVLDHRGEVYIPELNKTFQLGPQTRIFASQNPLKQGGGRKGLPQSFLNRFTKVYLKQLMEKDLLHVITLLYGEQFESFCHQFMEVLSEKEKYKLNGSYFDLHKQIIEENSNKTNTIDLDIDQIENEKISLNKENYVIKEPHLCAILKTANDQYIGSDLPERMVKFSGMLNDGIKNLKFGLKGGPFEINLRDLLRWCELLTNLNTGYIIQKEETFQKNFDRFILILFERMKLVYIQRMQSLEDQKYICEIFAKCFDCQAKIEEYQTISKDIALYWTNDCIYLNDIALKRQPGQQQLMNVNSSQPLLLLNSQRSTIKNIIESIYLEMPIILSGSTDSGKTKIIESICQLTNQAYDTDIIDDSVTGSFQQIDFNRHLEVLAQNIQLFSEEFLQEIFKSEPGSSKIIDVLISWHMFVKLSTTKLDICNSMSNKKLFIGRLEFLQKHIHKLILYRQNNGQVSNNLIVKKLQNFHKKLDILKQQVEQLGSLNTGGCFEWVDSKIVNSLRDGRYIVLEHVNLSSGAIVDRLNSAFESNGKLLISERGALSSNNFSDINADSENNHCNHNATMDFVYNMHSERSSMMLVKRAKNFQAFLTINPKYGQLSRAMRNRCIELSMPSNLDSYDWDDKRSLIYSNGIKEIDLINVLISLHENITKLTEHNNYNVTHLIQMAQLIVNYKRITYSNRRAIYESAMEIYINAATIDYMGYGLTYYHKRLHDLIIEAVESVKESNYDFNTESNCDYLKELTLHCNELNTIRMINMQLVPLKILLDTGLNNYYMILTKYLNQTKDLDTLKMTTITTDKLNDLSVYYVYLIYVISTMKDVEIRNHILSKLFKEKKQTLLEQYSQKLYECIKSFQSQENGKNLGFCEELPWNYKLFPRLRDYNKADKNTQFLSELNIKLIINLAIKDIPIYQKSMASLDLKQITALTYSQAINNGHITDVANNNFLRAISKFIENLSSFIKQQLHLQQNQNNNYNQNGDDNYLLDLFLGISWFNRLLTATNQRLFSYNMAVDKNCIDKIWLHFKWLEKNFLNKILNISEDLSIKNTNIYQQWQSLNKIGENLEIIYDKQILKKLYTKNFTQFQAFYQKKQIVLYELEEKMEDMLNLLPIYSNKNDRKNEETEILYKFIIQRRYINSSFFPVKLTNEIHLKKIDVHWKSNKKTKVFINKSIHNNLTNIINDFNECLDKMNNFSVLEEEWKASESRFEELNSYFNNNKNNEENHEKLVLNLNDEDKFLMDSLRDYFLIKACIAKVGKLVIEDNLLKAFTINKRFCNEITFISNNTKRFMLTINSEIFNHFNKLMNTLANHIADSKLKIKSEEEKFTKLMEFLNASYSSLRSYQRVLLNMTEKIQMENELIRLNALEILDRKRALLCNQGKYLEKSGPGSTVLLNLISRLLYQEDGLQRTVAIRYHNKWAMEVHKVQTLLWLNMHLINEHYNSIRHNYNQALQHCQWLMYEIQYVKNIQQDLSIKLNEKVFNSNKDDNYYIDKWQKRIQNLLKNAIYDTYKDNNNENNEIKCKSFIINNEYSSKKLFYLNSLLTFLIGAIELHILTFISSIDPVEKYNLKRKYAEEDHKNLVSMLYSYDIMRHTMKYQQFGHEFYKITKEKLIHLQVQESKYKNELALRPEEENKRRYLELIDIIQNFLRNSCDAKALDKLLELIENCYKLWIEYDEMKNKNQLNLNVIKSYVKKLLHTTNDTLNNINCWLRNAEYFLKQSLVKTAKYYYQDIVLPLQCAVDNIRYGLTNFQNIIQEFQNQYINFQCIFNEEQHGFNIYNCIENIFEFPNCNYLQIFKTKNENVNDETKCYSICESFPNGQENFYNLLYKAKLLEIQHRMRFEGVECSNVDSNIIQMCNDLLKIYHDINEIWQKEEEKRIQLKNEEQSLYIQKVKCENEDESIIEQREINEIFPTSIETDFKDIIESMNVKIDLSKQTEMTHVESVKNNTKNKQSNINRFILNSEDCIFVAKTFIEIFSKIDNNRKIMKLNSEEKENNHHSLLLDSFKYRLQTFMKLFNKYGAAFNENIDLTCYNALLLSIGLIRNENHKQHFDESVKEHYNVYKENNIAEIEKCIEFLVMMEQHIIEDLLSQFPEHGTLQEILLTIDKIRHLPNNAPVVRYNIGLQILRQKVSQWNEIAHKQIDLRKEEAEIALYIQKWTSMELQCWRNCLEQIYEKTEKLCYVYWFYIYDLVAEFINEKSQLNENDHMIKDETVTLLNHFMETSNYADFHIRLKLLKSFECYLDFSERITNTSNSKINLLKSMLYNLHMYYGQFEEAVQMEERKMIRLPIEKSLKEFVKIESYNKDISYIGMRNNIARIHRKLNKFLREYEKLLQQPIVTKIFQYKNSINNNNNNLSAITTNIKTKCFLNANIGLKKSNKLLNEMHNYQIFIDVNVEKKPIFVKCKDLTKILQSFECKYDLLQRLDKLYRQSSNVIKTIFVNLQYPRLNNELNEIIYDQKERYNDLRLLNVDRSKPKMKQISQAKQILQQKRKGLNDFFKILSVIGVNYKTGLLEMNVKEQIENYTMKRLINFENALQELPEKFSNFVTLENLNNLYAKCIFKLKVLKNQLLTPRKELGPANIDRLKGNAMEMFSIVQEQRQQLAGSVNDIHNYRKCLKQMDDLSILYEKYYANVNLNRPSLQKNFNPFNFVDLIKLRSILKSGFCKILHVFEQFELLLKNGLTDYEYEPANSEIYQVLFWQQESEELAQNQRLSKEAEYNKLMMNEGMKHIKCSQLMPFCLKINQLTTSALNKIIVLERKEFLDAQEIQLLIEEYRKIIGNIEEIIQVLTLTNLIGNGSHNINSRNNVREFSQQYSNFENASKNFNENLSLSYLPLAEPLLKFLEQQKLDSKRIFPFKQNALASEDILIDSYHEKSNQFKDNENSAQQNNTAGSSVKLLETILLSLQKLHKKYDVMAYSKDNSANFHQNGDDNDKGITMNMDKNYLKATLTNEWLADWNNLNLSKLMGKLLEILKSIQNYSSYSIENHHEISVLLKLKPFLEDIFSVMKYYFMQLTITHCLSVKMLSTMLSVFNEICEKGFCIPEDLLNDIEEQEMSPGSSQQQQQEESKFGLEDGEGEKDASDKIESEDQLDEAKLPNDKDQDENGEKAEEKQKCKEDDGIEMSEDFDGAIQDLEQDGSGESDDEKGKDEDLDKEMDHTDEGAEQLDEQLWGDDKDQKEDEEKSDEENEPKMENSDGKGTKDEKDKHNNLNDDNELATTNEADENQSEDDNLEAINESKNNQQKSQPDIDKMKNPSDEGDEEEQTNACHNELEDPPEAEEMDLGDMRTSDDEINNEHENMNDENMFDIDRMKEDNHFNENDVNDEEMPEADAEKDANDNESNDEEGSNSDDQDDEEDSFNMNKTDDKIQEELNDEMESNENEENNKNDIQQVCDDSENKEEAMEEKMDKKHSDKQSSKEEKNAEAIPQTGADASKEQEDPEKIITNDDNIKQEDKLDEQNTGEESTGHGQATSEKKNDAHQGVAKMMSSGSKDEEDDIMDSETRQHKRKQGQNYEERTLEDKGQNTAKRLKTIDRKTNDKQVEDDDEDGNKGEEIKESDKEEDKSVDTEANFYQHVKDAKSTDRITLDDASKEQQKIQHNPEVENGEEKIEDDKKDIEEMDVMDEEEEMLSEPEGDVSAETFDKKLSEKRSIKETRRLQDNEDIEMLDIEIDGEMTETTSVKRNDETAAFCRLEELNCETNQVEDAATEFATRVLYEEQIQNPQLSMMDNNSEMESWQKISSRMSQNASDLCEQLRLILEPTKCTRLRGDYRTGRRINMRKIIPYIASQFRKDKIWLRRTKPAKRDYRITIAIDDSKSMHHNNSKLLTLEAVSLISQALTLLESGQLSVLSFGEKVQLILNHSEQFDGIKLMRQLNFSQDKTKISELLNFVRVKTNEEGYLSADNGLFENLLLILSDGRNIFSEGAKKVKNAIKLARLQRIFLVYIIIDNPENKNSIFDIQTMEMLPDKKINIKSYLDEFPFPYYVIVRNLNQLPLVLSEAMRQWFELVNSEQ